VARGVHESAFADLLCDEHASPQSHLDHPCAIPAAVILFSADIHCESQFVAEEDRDGFFYTFAADVSICVR
jgi:hypothetical protein